MRWKIASVILVASALLLGVMLWPEPSCTRTLPDGTTLVMAGLKIGKTNVYVHGSFLSKSLGRLSPRQGFKVLGMRLDPPLSIANIGVSDSEILTAEIRLLSGSPQEQKLLAPRAYDHYRMLISANEDFAIVPSQYFNLRKYPDGIFATMVVTSFPRDAKVLRFRLEERDDPKTRDWREIATFVMKNPKPARVESWPFTNNPVFKLANGIQVEIGELAVRREPVNSNTFNVADYTAILPVRVSLNRQAHPEWIIHDGTVRDSSGNTEWFNYLRAASNDWMFYRTSRSLDPNQAWKFNVNLARESNFPGTDLRSFTVPWPLAVSVETNLGGFPFRVRSENQMLLLGLLINAGDGLRLTFVNATYNQGLALHPDVGGWSQHFFRANLYTLGITNLQATVAIHTNYPLEFTLKPRFEKTSPAQGAK
jgi:hypothetical protein